MEKVRVIEAQIEKNLFQGKVILLLGARRVGKTTLSKRILSKHSSSKYINCELLQNKTVLETTNTEVLKKFLGEFKLIVLDEAQNIINIGQILKVLNDTFPEMQIIATGSSSFDIMNNAAEPLTGRSRIFILYPFSLEEVKQQNDWLTLNAKIGHMLRFGLYPEVFDKPDDYAIEELNNIASNYLYKDILQFERLKRSDLIINLLRALAFQVGNEVSFGELAKLLGENVHTVKRYIELLEKSYVIYRLKSYSKNLRNEIAHGQKIYFLDLGIRNSIIQNFNPLELRDDVGAIWENFCVIERIKFHFAHRRFVNFWFWRNYEQKEIDLIEEFGGELHTYEFKYNPKKKNIKMPASFAKTYQVHTLEIINTDNFYKVIE